MIHACRSADSFGFSMEDGGFSVVNGGLGAGREPLFSLSLPSSTMSCSRLRLAGGVDSSTKTGRVSGAATLVHIHL